MKNKKAYYTTGQVAEICGLSYRTVIKMFEEGFLTGFKIPPSKKFRKISRESLIEFMKNAKMPKSWQELL